jgi:hypothetical protein
MAGFGVAAKARIAVVSDTPTGALPPGVSSAGSQWLDTSSPAFWVGVWFLVLLGLVYLVFHGLIF